MQEATHDLQPDSHAGALAAAFHHQLETMNMATEYPTGRSLAATELFMAFGGGVANLINEALDDAGVFGSYASQRTYSAAPDFSTGLYMASRWANHVVGELGALVSVGIWYPEVGSYGQAIAESLGEAVSSKPKFFVTLESEELMKLAESPPPSPWLHDTDEYLLARDVDLFPADADERAGAIRSWIIEHCTNLKAHLDGSA